jgi:hypothetical protein
MYTDFKEVIFLTINPITLVLILLLVLPILQGFIFKFSSNNLKQGIQELNSNISFIVSIFIGIYFYRRVFVQRDGMIYKYIIDILPKNLVSYFESNPIVAYAIIIPLTILLLYKLFNIVLEFVNRFTLYPLADNIENTLENRSEFSKRIIGAIFKVPKSMCYILFATFLLNAISIVNINIGMSKYLEASTLYNYLCREVVIPVSNSKIAKQLPNIINNSFKVVVKEVDNSPNTNKENLVSNNENSGKRVVVYYNGITLDEGIKSNSKIDSLAKDLTIGETLNKGRAKILYNWVGSNIEYDHDKAEKVLSNDFNIKSGAIPTFQTRKGICFDYSCLYVAMCRANGLKVRIVTGEGFNGVSWVSHAWNQVYIQEEGKWINVDTTFFKGGNYFNSRRFDMDHRNAKIAGEW